MSNQLQSNIFFTLETMVKYCVSNGKRRCTTVEPLWKGQESLTKVAKFGPFRRIILYKSCLFCPSWQATSFERPPNWVAFIKGFHSITHRVEKVDTVRCRYNKIHFLHYLHDKHMRRLLTVTPFRNPHWKRGWTCIRGHVRSCRMAACGRCEKDLAMVAAVKFHLSTNMLLSDLRHRMKNTYLKFIDVLEMATLTQWMEIIGEYPAPVFLLTLMTRPLNGLCFKCRASEPRQITQLALVKPSDTQILTTGIEARFRLVSVSSVTSIYFNHFCWHTD